MSTVIVNLSMLLLPLIDLLLLDLHLQIKTCHRLRLTIKSIMSDGKEAYTDRHVLSRRGFSSCTLVKCGFVFKVVDPGAILGESL